MAQFGDYVMTLFLPIEPEGTLEPTSVIGDYLLEESVGVLFSSGWLAVLWDAPTHCRG